MTSKDGCEKRNLIINKKNIEQTEFQQHPNDVFRNSAEAI